MAVKSGTHIGDRARLIRSCVRKALCSDAWGLCNAVANAGPC